MLGSDIQLTVPRDWHFQLFSRGAETSGTSQVPAVFRSRVPSWVAGYATVYRSASAFDSDMRQARSLAQTSPNRGSVWWREVNFKGAARARIYALVEVYPGRSASTDVDLFIQRNGTYPTSFVFVVNSAPPGVRHVGAEALPNYLLSLLRLREL